MKTIYRLLKKIYYSSLHIITLGKGVPITINGFRLKMPTRYYRYFPSDYERENFKFFKENARKGMVAVDIGAHIGVFSIFMQRTTQNTVYSFEPTHSTIEILKKNLRLNKCSDSIKIIPKAVDEKKGKVTFYIGKDIGSVGNTLVADQSRATRGAYEVEVINIDAFSEEKQLKIDFIKIDAEGTELGVLKGGHETLTKQRPFIILALHPQTLTVRGDTLEEIWDFVIKYKYCVFLNGSKMEKKDFCSQQDIFDVQLIPLEKLS